jgi:tetratricopeptide (TPR) repeat protein
MTFACTQLAKNSFCILFVITALLISACSSGPTSNNDATPLNAKSTPLAAKDSAVYSSALANFEKGNVKAAATALTKITQDNPGYFDGWINLAIANYQLKDLAAAKRALAHAQQLQATSAQLNNIRALISTEDGQYKDAEQLYLASLKLEPKNANTHYNLALLYDIYYQDLPQAVAHYESYLALSSQKDEETEAWTAELKQKLLDRGAQ